MTIHSSEYDQVTPGIETTNNTRLTDSSHERRPSLGETSKRGSRSRERDKIQEPFLPDVVGTEGWFVTQNLSPKIAVRIFTGI